MCQYLRILFLTLAACLFLSGRTEPAIAETLWSHNNSVMRFSYIGDLDDFQITYEKPKESLQAAGVENGTVLIEGIRKGDRLTGTANRFSASCRAPLEYAVAGQIIRESRIVLRGRREVYDRNCRPTGRWVTDNLVFEFISEEPEQ